MARYLITGGAGFIGSHIAEELCRTGHQVIILDNLISGCEERIAHLNVEFVKDTIFNKEMVEELVDRVDVIFHLASLSKASQNQKGKLEKMAIDSLGVVSIMEAAKNNRNCKVICPGTEIAYYDKFITKGLGTNNQKNELLNSEPQSIATYYSKVFREYFCVDTTFLNFQNVFGPWQKISSASASIIPELIEKALKNELLTIYGNQHQTFDSVYVKDVVRANTMATILEGDSYNVCSTWRISLLQLAKKIIDLTNSRSDIRFINKTPDSDLQEQPMYSEEPNLLEFTHSYTLDRALKETIEYHNTSTSWA